jgi:hypothetical protein
MTPEQIAILGSKRLALDLDLSQDQQTKVKELQLQRVTEHRAIMQERKLKRAEKDSLSPDARFNRINNRLDRQLAYKSEMKEILTEEQYAKWDKLHAGWDRHNSHRRFHHQRRGAKR